MFVVVADEVLEGETVVASDEIDAVVRLAAIVLIEIAAAGEARGKFADLPAVPFPELAHRVAVLAVPFGPAGRKLS